MDETTINRAVGRALASMRTASGYTQSEVAAAIGTTPSAVSRWENGQRTAGPFEVMQLAHVYGATGSAVYEAAEAAVSADLTRTARQLQDTINARMRGQKG